MKFSVIIVDGWSSLEGNWRALDESRFDTLYIADHLSMPIPDPWPFLAHVAAKTRRIRLGTHVTAAPLHHPAKLAKEVATVDLLSNGRATLGIGAGWAIGDFDPYGFRRALGRDSLDILDETVRIVKALWTIEGATFEGRHYRLTGGANLQPKPIQKPHPPIIIGTNSENRFLTLAAASADGLNTWQLGAAEVARRRDIVSGFLREHGRSIGDFAITSDVLVAPNATGEQAEQMAHAISDYARKGGRSALATRWDSTGVLYGDADNMAAQVQEFERAGVDELVVLLANPEQVRWFDSEVISRAAR